MKAKAAKRKAGAKAKQAKQSAESDDEEMDDDADEAEGAAPDPKIHDLKPDLSNLIPLLDTLGRRGSSRSPVRYRVLTHW